MNNIRFIFQTRGLNTFIHYILTHRNIHLYEVQREYLYNA